MNPENQNQAEDPSNVKLVFDIMPQGGDEPAHEAPAKTHSGAPWPPAPRPVGTGPAPQAPKKPGLFSSDHPDKKWIMISLAIVALASIGAAVYFIFFQKPTIKTPATNTQATGEPQLKAVWLKKYFGSETCADESVCGPNADADADGLSNIQEQDKGTDPTKADTDFDGLSDIDEIQIYSTDPLSADTDGDGFEDGAEVRGGFSPIVATADKMAPMEMQSIADNVARYGQHEPTMTFLALTAYKTRFNNNSTTTPQIALSVPKDWKTETVGDTVKLSNADNTLRLSIAYTPQLTLDAAKQAYEQALKGLPENQTIKITSGALYRLNFSAYEVAFKAGEKTIHEKAGLFQKEQSVFDVRFSSPEDQWSVNQLLINVILDSIR